VDRSTRRPDREDVRVNPWRVGVARPVSVSKIRPDTLDVGKGPSPGVVSFQEGGGMDSGDEHLAVEVVGLPWALLPAPPREVGGPTIGSWISPLDWPRPRPRPRPGHATLPESPPRVVRDGTRSVPQVGPHATWRGPDPGYAALGSFLQTFRHFV
jgi:hypothetical protein